MKQNNILLGVSGGIAAYKSAELVRLLRQDGFQVRVVMTAAAQRFVTPLTFQALSGHPVHCDLLDEEAEAGMGHIELARWADWVIVAPGTANLVARLAQGLGDDLLTTVCLATQAPLFIAPAMNQAMWMHPATQENIQTLRRRDTVVWGPAEGAQACGEVGPGRMLEPVELVNLLRERAAYQRVLTGKKVLITAGPTREAVDPVRYLSNHSTGKMGYALAQAARLAGAEVHLVSGPTCLSAPGGVTMHWVQSASEMLDRCVKIVGGDDAGVDLFIGAAAVADYRPQEVAAQKLKKQPGQQSTQLHLIENPDVIASVASLPSPPYTVGFAAETEQLLANARAKLGRKRIDMVIANNVAESGIGFNSEDNAVTAITAEQEQAFPRQPKQVLARRLIEHIAAVMGLSRSEPKQ